MNFRFHINFLDKSLSDSVVGTAVILQEGMLIIDHGPTKGQSGYNIRAIKDWYSEPVED